MSVQIKIFEHSHIASEPQHFDEIENMMNQFLLTIDGQKVLAVEYKYLLTATLKSPGRTRCTGFVIYET